MPEQNNFPDNVVLVRDGVDFTNASSFFLWDENSPLPPGMRYVELADIYVVLLANPERFESLNNYYILDLDESILPIDSHGNIRRNLRSSGIEVTGYNGLTLDLVPSSAAVAAALNTIYEDDSMWTGEVVDPLIWQDDWWDYLLVNKERMAIYLEAHPGCKLNA